MEGRRRGEWNISYSYIRWDVIMNVQNIVIFAAASTVFNLPSDDQDWIWVCLYSYVLDGIAVCIFVCILVCCIFSFVLDKRYCSRSCCSDIRSMMNRWSNYAIPSKKVVIIRNFLWRWDENYSTMVILTRCIDLMMKVYKKRWRRWRLLEKHEDKQKYE